MFLDIYYSKVNYSVQVYMPLLMPNLVCIIQKSFTNSDLNRSTKCTTFMKTCKSKKVDVRYCILNAIHAKKYDSM